MTKRILIYFTNFGATLGGSEYLPLAFIAELQQAGCDITLALNWPSDLDRAVRLSGIPVNTARLRIELVKPKNALLRKFDAVLPFYRTRRLKTLAKEADICISTVNMMDFGKPAHHFIYLMRHFGDNAFYDYVMHRPPLHGTARFRRRFRTWVAETLLRPMLGMRSTRKILADPRERIYPNSRYVERVMREYYGPFNSTVFYPPTTFDFPAANGGRDPLRIVSIGRLIPEKKILEIVDIAERARHLSGAEIELHLAGPADPGPYADEIRRLAADRPWLKLAGALYGEEKEKFLLSGTYAVHARRDEEFGIAVAEYLKAGLIAIVPDEGGSPEVVDSPELTYHDRDDAAKILAKLLANAEFREEQRRRCRERAEFFSRGAYAERQKTLLSEILNGK